MSITHNAAGAAKLEPVRVRSNLASKIAIPQTTPIMCIHQSPNPTIAPAWSRLAKIRNAPGATTKLRNTSLPSHKLKPRNSIVRSKIDMGSLYKNDPNEPKWQHAEIQIASALLRPTTLRDGICSCPAGSLGHIFGSSAG